MAKKSNTSGQHAPPTKDPRFQRLHTDPRFNRPKKAEHKVKLDERFAHVLTDKNFSSKGKVDRYGRKIEEKDASELKRYYKLDGEGDESDSGSDEEEDAVALKGASASASESESEDEAPTRYDPMRGEGVSSSEDDSDEEDYAGALAEADNAGEESDDAEDVPRGEETKRFAIVNLDWDHVRAVDLFTVLNGFKPDGGTVRNITIYPSAFGKERMALEATVGPPKDIFKAAVEDSNEDSNEGDEEFITAKNFVKADAGEKIDGDALRLYQLERLRYFYAVATCDSVATASTIYHQCDGAEYEASANFFDLRFIPDDVVFDEEARDSANTTADGYKPRDFSTSALQHSSVKLTWDEDNVDRTSITRRHFTDAELQEQDFHAYLASSGSEDSEGEASGDEDPEVMRARYKQLLADTAEGSNPYADVEREEDEGQEMEITFAPGLSERVSAKLQAREEAKKVEIKAKMGETPLEAYMRKQKERRQARKGKKAQADAATGADAEAPTQGGAVEAGFDEAAFEAAFAKGSEAQAFSDDEVSGFDVTDIGETPASTSAPKLPKGKSKAERMARRAEREEEERKAKELELLLMDSNETPAGETQGGEGRHFDMKDILKAQKAKGKKKKYQKEVLSTADDFKIDVQDERFAPMHDSHLFALDPTNPHFKETDAMKKLITERRRRNKSSGPKEAAEEPKVHDPNAPVEKEADDITNLVMSIKRKAQMEKPRERRKRTRK